MGTTSSGMRQSHVDFQSVSLKQCAGLRKHRYGIGLHEPTSSRCPGTRRLRRCSATSRRWTSRTPRPSPVPGTPCTLPHPVTARRSTLASTPATTHRTLKRSQRITQRVHSPWPNVLMSFTQARLWRRVVLMVAVPKGESERAAHARNAESARQPGHNVPQVRRHDTSACADRAVQARCQT